MLKTKIDGFKKNMNINAFWIYGILINNIGKYEIHEEKTKFNLNGKLYESSWLASVEINKFCHENKIQRNITYVKEFFKQEFHLVSGQVGNEIIIGFKIDSEIDRLNYLPEKEILHLLKLKIIEILNKFGIYNIPEPEIFFLVEITS